MSEPARADSLPASESSGSIGEISARIGGDVRELVVMGYSDAQILRVLSGELALSDLLSQLPAGQAVAATPR